MDRVVTQHAEQSTIESGHCFEFPLGRKGLLEIPKW